MKVVIMGKTFVSCLLPVNHFFKDSTQIIFMCSNYAAERISTIRLFFLEISLQIDLYQLHTGTSNCLKGYNCK